MNIEMKNEYFDFNKIINKMNKKSISTFLYEMGRRHLNPLPRKIKYNFSLLPNRYLASIEAGNKNFRSAIEKTGFSMGYPAWNLLYYILLSSIPLMNKDIVILETGTHLGLSTIILAQVLKDTDSNGTVFTVDKDKKAVKIARQNVLRAGLIDYVNFNIQDSILYLSKITEQKQHIHFAFLDSNHDYRHVLKEFSIIYPKIQPVRGKVFFDNSTYGGVAKALKYIKSHYDGNIIEFDNSSWAPPGNALWQPDLE
jgi:predicted O-methyltransferase YrrM